MDRERIVYTVGLTSRRSIEELKRHTCWKKQDNHLGVVVCINRDLKQLGRERQRRRLLNLKLSVFPFLVFITRAFCFRFPEDV